MTNSEILKIFYEKYPEIRAVDYRPLCPELFTKNLIGVTIWLENGDVMQYYPKEAQDENSKDGLKNLYEREGDIERQIYAKFCCERK